MNATKEQARYIQRARALAAKGLPVHVTHGSWGLLSRATVEPSHTSTGTWRHSESPNRQFNKTEHALNHLLNSLKHSRIVGVSTPRNSLVVPSAIPRKYRGTWNHLNAEVPAQQAFTIKGNPNTHNQGAFGVVYKISGKDVRPS